MDPRINRTKSLLKRTLKDELESNTFDEITVIQICNKSTINKTTFYRHYKDLYDLYKDVLIDIFNDGIESIYSDCSIFFSNPYKCFFLNYEVRNTDIYRYFKKQLRENPVDLFDSLYPELLSEKIYANKLLTKNDTNDLKLEVAMKAMRSLLSKDNNVSFEDRATIWKELIETLFKDECNYYHN